jgi:hypothetical protein
MLILASNARYLSKWKGEGGNSIGQTSRAGGLGDWEDGGRGDEEQREEKRASAAGAGEAEPADGGGSFWPALHLSGAFSPQSLRSLVRRTLSTIL